MVPLLQGPPLTSSMMSVAMVGAALASPPCPRVIVVDTDYAHVDTGGAEAMVQLALAVAELCGGKTYRGFETGRHVINEAGHIAPRLLAEYPEIARLPRLGNAEMDLSSGDLVIVPESRRCDRSFAARGVHWYIWALSATTRKHNFWFLQRGCRLLSHNSYLALNTKAAISLPQARILHPYITPSTVQHCRDTLIHRRAQELPMVRPVVLLDSGVPTEVELMVIAVCAANGCQHVRVDNITRSRVHELIASAAVMVDWCMPGTERLAVEAVLCGAVLLTNDCLSGSSAADFPIPARNVLSSPWEVDDALGRVFGDWMRESAEYEPMRVQYAQRFSAASLKLEAAAFLQDHQLRDRNATTDKQFFRP